jgi:hypothetical protein
MKNRVVQTFAWKETAFQVGFGHGFAYIPFHPSLSIDFFKILSCNILTHCPLALCNEKYTVGLVINDSFCKTGSPY